MNITVPTYTGAKPYCGVTSEAPSESTNLQLFSLRQAFKYWDELQKDKLSLSTYQITEHLVFIIVCTGTSVAQLLGQNASHVSPGTYVKPPKPLFAQVFGPTHAKKADFDEFISIYDDCRHFGSPKHPSISALTEQKCQTLMDFAIGIWDDVVRQYIADGHDPNNKLDRFTSVKDLI